MPVDLGAGDQVPGVDVSFGSDVPGARSCHFHCLANGIDVGDEDLRKWVASRSWAVWMVSSQFRLLFSNLQKCLDTDP